MTSELPLLHEVAAGSLDANLDEVGYRSHGHRWGYRFFYGALEGIDRDNRQVLIAPILDEDGSEIMGRHRIRYDYLVLAVGSVTNDFGTPGAAQYAVPLEDPDQATRFNRRLINACLRANSQSEPVRPGQLHVAIIGAGATGTELAAELHRTVRAVLAYGLDRIDAARDVHIVLIEAADRILPLGDIGAELAAQSRPPHRGRCHHHDRYHHDDSDDDANDCSGRHSDLREVSERFTDSP